MPRSRHRKPERPPPSAPGAPLAVTGKARNALKNALYAHPLPLDAPAPSSGGATQAKAAAAQQQQQGWAEWLRSLVPFARTQQEQRLPVVLGTWDPLTRCVWLQITPSAAAPAAAGPSSRPANAAAQSAAVRLLWERGFFGKGSLSRSEPTWRDRKANAIRVQRARERGGNVFTPEELTAQRRRERKAAKIARARLAVRAGTQLADGIVALGGELTAEDEKALEEIAERELVQEDEAGAGATTEQTESGYGKHIPGLIYLRPQREAQATEQAPRVSAAGEEGALEEEEEEVQIEEVEVLQLSSFEVLFLAGMLGVLEVDDEHGNRLSLSTLYALLLSSSLPPSLSSALLATPSPSELQASQAQWARPDNPFLLQYVAYHHFRSLGWVVKSGLKFCIDFLLYKRGPVFSHAEFAVLVIPEYENPDDKLSSPFPPGPNDGEKDWVWFSTMNRVNTQVLKTLVLCYVSIPPLARMQLQSLSSPEAFVQGLKRGDTYSVREVTIRRWTPARMRA